jgi:hypothetical protein
MSGNKLPKKYDDVIDTKLIQWFDVLNPYFKSVGFTPNGITTLSFGFGLLACYFYYKNSYLLSSLCYLISYFFDGMDGYFARVYKMGSKFGSYYDFMSDNLVGAILIYLFLKNKKLSVYTKTILFFIIFCLICITAYHLNCQEKYVHITNKKYESDGLKYLPFECQRINDMKYTRYFGPGVLYCSLAFIIFIHKLII